MRVLARGLATLASAPVRLRQIDQGLARCPCSLLPLRTPALQSTSRGHGFHSAAPSMISITEKDRKELKTLFRDLGFEEADMDLDLDAGKLRKQAGEKKDGASLPVFMPELDKKGNPPAIYKLLAHAYDELHKTRAGQNLIEEWEDEFNAEMFTQSEVEDLDSDRDLLDEDDDDDDEDDDGDEKGERNPAGEDMDNMEEEGEEKEIDFEDIVPENLECRIIEIRRVSNQTGGGKVVSYAGLVAVGNCNGAAAYARGKSFDPNKAVIVATRKAIKRLQHIPRFNEHTINHDLYVKFRQTRLYMRPRPQGHGLVAHDIIQDLCMLSGITDISANIVGNTHKLNMVKAFFKAVSKQKTIEEACQGRGKNIVTFRKAVKVEG